MHRGSGPSGLAPAPRRVPAAFWLAELLPLRWWYLLAPLIVAIPPIALWLQRPRAFAAVAVLTMAGIYAVQLWGAGVRLGLLRWGRVADVVDTEILSRATLFNAYPPRARAWRVTRQRYSGQVTKTRIRYSLDGQQSELVLRGRDYVDGVILADQRRPARARCVTAFSYDLDRDDAGNWVGALPRRVWAGMACWSLVVIAWLALAAFAATGLGTPGVDDTPAAPVPQAGTLQVSGAHKAKTVPCNGGYLSVSGVDNTVTVTGHCTSVSVSGNGNHVTVDSTDAVSAAGRDNVVRYHWGSPKIDDVGTGNSVAQG
ncbi:DUF3060 domain-containing protein [Mycobacterium rhizamassiliense]|uniref:DUF3060 domain-containing protein n=1 Tax=Mycobacterium rhizamassiliense TaxID=1841860 RepID=UPI001FE6A127|nr:DUF3060 domain-containing protein [Mycobacterium rhizamassiliense]